MANTRETTEKPPKIGDTKACQIFGCHRRMVYTAKTNGGRETGWSCQNPERCHDDVMHQAQWSGSFPLDPITSSTTHA